MRAVFVISVASLIGVWALTTESGRSLSKSVAQPPRRAIESFGVAKNGDLLLVPTSVEGETHWFLLDTGCTLPVFDDSLRSLVGPWKGTIKLDAFSGAEVVSLFDSPRLSIGRIECNRPAGVVCVDMNRRVQGHDVVGALGVDSFPSHPLEINFDAGTACFIDSIGSDAGTKVNLEWELHRNWRAGPYVAVTIEGLGTERFLVDTGYRDRASGGLRAKLFELLAANGRLVSVGYAQPELSATKNRFVVVPHGRVNAVSLKGVEQRDMVFGKGEFNVLGLGYLSRYVVTFDFQQGAMYLRKGKRFAARDKYDLSGIRFCKYPSGVLIKGVAAGSPAEGAGLMPGDLVLSVDNKPTTSLSAFDFGGLFCVAGEHVVVLLRGGNEITVPLRL